ncbi:MAG: GGDEF domain-containing protein [Porphyrobacter sp.]|nr:GGDEF domain-containing protein [Porphyrobacter sp.]
MFIQIPRILASYVLLTCAIIALLASNLISSSIGFAPIYLLICAFSAWFVGNRFAVALFVLVASIQFLRGEAIIFRGTEVITFVNASLQFFSALAVILMLGVAREALEVEWRSARLDPLTGALNRKAFFEAAKDEAGHGSMAVIAYADVDGLKKLNDKFGHEAGDGALRDFAARINKSIRKNDLFARMGGDEFVIMLSVRDINAAKSVAERINSVLNLELEDDETKLKCSLGILFLPAGTKAIDAELRQADTLMYLAKRKRVGLVMAMSAQGDPQKLVPFATNADARGQQRTVVRAVERKPETTPEDKLSLGTIAA